MIDRQLLKELNKIHVPAYDIRKLEETASKAGSIKPQLQNLRMGPAGFFLDQLRFIRKEIWFLKILFSVLILAFIPAAQMTVSGWIWTLIAVSGPILCLMNAREICHILQPGMLELQMTARNSFRKVLMVRLTVFGSYDLVFFGCMASGVSIFQETAVWHILLYGIVPYAVMCFGCLLILNRCREENMLLYTGTWGAFLCCIIVILKISDQRICQPSYIPIWLGTGIVVFSGIATELYSLFRKAGGNLNEINYGTSV